MEWERTGENNCGTGWGESREWNGREQERTTVALVGKRVENGMGENRENNCGIGWGESREWNGREQERTTVALVGERVENGMGENRREQLWHWLGRE